MEPGQTFDSNMGLVVLELHRPPAQLQYCNSVPISQETWRSVPWSHGRCFTVRGHQGSFLPIRRSVISAVTAGGRPVRRTFSSPAALRSNVCRVSVLGGTQLGNQLRAALDV